MPSRRPQPRAPKLSRKEAKARTHENLITAVLDLVREGGLASLTTTKVTRRAGVAQSIFYDHFADMNDALTSAAESAATVVRGALSAERATIDVASPSGGVRATFAAAIDGLVAEPVLSELLLRYRRDPVSPLGDCIRRILDEARSELIADMESLGLADRLPQMELHADMYMAMALAAVEGILDGRFAEREACLDVLTRITAASLAADR